VFLVAMAAIAFEVMLTRYFAIASWAEYGYWVISIAMVGLAFSGVLLSLFQRSAVHLGERSFFPLCVLLMVACTAGFHFVTVNPFNPQQLQNPLLWKSQLVNIGAYYLALFPFFFLSGTFLGLAFILGQDRITRLYAFDLVGAGVGAAVVLVLMFVVHPFYLVCFVPLMPWAAAMLNLPGNGWKRRAPAAVLAIAVMLGSTGWLLAKNQARFCEYKPITPVLLVEGNQKLKEIRSPRGYYMLLDNFTERRDLPLSNNSSLLNLGDAPAEPGLYKDGNRLTSLAANETSDYSYLKGALSTAPYVLRPGARALLVGSSGGFRLGEAASIGVGECVALESDPVVYRLAQDALRENASARAALLNDSPQSFLARSDARFDIIDIAEDYLDAGQANKYAITREAILRYFGALKPDGIVSLPVSIREWTVYAEKFASTVAAALRDAGIKNPADHIAVYRNEWAVRILVTRQPCGPADVQKLVQFCSDLSFDTPYYPGIDTSKVEVWNTLPRVSFGDTDAALHGDDTQDALMETLPAILRGEADKEGASSFFDLSPMTDDRPFLQYAFRLSRLPQLFRGLDLVPQEGIGYLVNVAVLAQASLFALIVLVLPFVRMRGTGVGTATLFKGTIYFAALGLGFLFVEITLIEKFAYLLNDSVSSFAVVLSGMLVFSGAGSFYAARFKANPRRGLALATVVIAVSLLACIFLLDPIILRLLRVPYPVQCAAILVLIAPASFALGVPFPSGIGVLQGPMAGFIPLAWAINGAFSVISSPLASILAVSYGYRWILVAALVLYPVALWAFPGTRAAALSTKGE
jgi:hypothetical protein